jgi:hypothetical protein
VEVGLWLYEDAIDVAELFVRNSEKPSLDQQSQRMCIESSLRELVGAAEWSAMKKNYRIHLQPTLASINYTYAGTNGTATDNGITDVDREVIISGAVWPTPANSSLGQAGITVLDGELRLGEYTLNCLPDNTNTSDPTTRLQLDPVFYPSIDYTTASNLMLGFPKYPLPPDFAAGIVAADRNAWFIGTYVPPDQWFLMDKYRVFTGVVRNFTIMSDPKRYGQQALYVHPCPMDPGEYDLQIKAWRRPMRISGKEPWNYTGTVTVNANSSAVVGVNTAFDQRMVGAVLRVAGAAGSGKPTGTAGKNPYLFQQTIATVTDATHLTLTGAAPTFPGSSSTLTGVGYSVSDPCDVPASLWDCFKAACFAELAQYCAPKEYLAVRARYETKLRAARGADNQNRTQMGVGSGNATYSRLRDNQSRPSIGG